MEQAKSDEIVQEFAPEADEVPDSPWSFQMDDMLFEDDENPLVRSAQEDESPNDTPRIDADDFESPEVRYIFLAVKDKLRTACNVNTQQSKRVQAVRWIFMRGTQDKDGLDFLHAVTALGGRHFVVQARLQYQMWRAGVGLTEPMNILSDGLPGCLASEIEARIGPGLSVDMARQIWAWPAMPALELRKHFEDVDQLKYIAAIKNLDANGYIGMSSGLFYFISRNPDLMPLTYLRNFSFSRSIVGDF